MELNFIGCESNYAEAELVIFGAPYDGTTSNRPGARFAGKVIRNESFGIETYSPYQDRDLCDYRIHDAGELELPFGNPEPALEMIYDFSKKIHFDNKLPVMLGGEHLVTLPAVKAAYEKFSDLCVIHFDAHADLRDEYLGQKLSHASVMRRCHDFLGDNRIFQFGIRSGDREEFRWGENHVFTRKFDLTGLEEIAEKLKGKPIYFTLDLDVIDPAEFPATGTPEAGGISFTELMRGMKLISGLNIVGCDMNELSPPYDGSGISAALACKTLRELLLFVAKGEKSEK